MECGHIQGLPTFFEYPLLSPERIKLRTFKFCRYIHSDPSEQKPFKIWEKMERGRIQGLPQFFEYPLLSQERIKLRTSNFAVYSQRPSEQKPFKILGQNGAWEYPGTFCTHILSIDWNKSPLQISGKVAGCVVRTSKTFQGTHILGASHGLLCDSSAVLFLRGVTVSMSPAWLNSLSTGADDGTLALYLTNTLILLQLLKFM